MNEQEMVEIAGRMFDQGYDEFDIAEHLGIENPEEVEELLNRAFPEGWEW